MTLGLVVDRQGFCSKLLASSGFVACLGFSRFCRYYKGMPEKAHELDRVCKAFSLKK
jgi:hypothetical protein